MFEIPTPPIAFLTEFNMPNAHSLIGWKKNIYRLMEKIPTDDLWAISLAWMVPELLELFKGII
jgi:hypothetical protein